MEQKKNIKYKADKWGNDLEVVEIEKETDNSVWVKGRRNAKSNSYEAYFDTIQQAKEWVISIADRDILSAENSLMCEKKSKEDLLKKIAKWR